MKRLAAVGAYLLYLLFMIEVLCAAYSWSGLSPTHHVPPYLLADGQDYIPLSEWRSQGEAWGAWHTPSRQARHMKACFDATYRANAFGARDKERSLAAPAHPRYVVLGDSFVEGVGMNAEQRLSDVLEAKTGHEFLNFGGVDFGPLQYEIIYQRLASRFEHDGVLVFILPDNDFTDNDPRIWQSARRYRPVYGPDGSAVYPPPAATAAARDSLLPRSFWTYFWAYGAVTDLRLLLASRDMRPPSEQQGHYSGYRDATPAAIAQVLGSLSRIQRSAGDKTLSVVLIPRPSDLAAYRQNAVLPVSEAFQRFAKASGVRLLDLLPILANDADFMSLYLPCDGHWSARGNRVAAEAVYQAWFK